MCDEINIALTDWPTDRIPEQFIEGLSRFDNVWCGSESLYHAVFHSFGENRGRVVDVPCDPKLWKGRNAFDKTDEYVFYSIGSWHGEDNLQDVFLAFVEEFSPEENVRLLLVCPDCWIRDAEDLALAADPNVRVSITHRLPRTEKEFWGIHLSGDCYVKASRRMSRSMHERAAKALTNDGHFYTGFYPARAYLETVHGVDARDFVRAPQQWKRIDKTARIEVLRDAYKVREEARQRRYDLLTWEYAGKDINGRLYALTIMRSFSENRNQHRDRAIEALKSQSSHYFPQSDNDIEPEPSICFIIPHRGLGLANIESTILSLAYQTLPGDEIVVSDQGSGQSILDDLLRYAIIEEQDLTLVVDKTPPQKWNISRARNLGVKAAPTHDFYMCVDGDIVLTETMILQIRDEIKKRKRAFFVPIVGNYTARISPRDLPIDEWSGDPNALRPATGCTIIAREDLFKANGWDEEYQGWGNEDIDLLYRLEKLGLKRVTLENLDLLYHQNHGGYFGETRPTGGANHDRLEARRKDNFSSPTNPNGWGENGETVVKRGLGGRSRVLL
jgi:hypothetical protein